MPALRFESAASSKTHLTRDPSPKPRELLIPHRKVAGGARCRRLWETWKVATGCPKCDVGWGSRPHSVRSMV